MRLLTLLSCILVWGFWNAQEPGAKLDFGKYKKSKAAVWYLHKTPSDFSWEKSSLLQPPIDYTQAKIHYSRTFLGDTTSVSINDTYVNHNPEPELLTPIARYTSTKKVTNKDWNLFRRYVRDSIAIRILCEYYGVKNVLTPTYTTDKNGIKRKKHESEWSINWDTKINYKKQLGNEDYYSLSQMMYRQHETLDQEIRIDDRKLNYSYPTFNYKNQEEYRYFKNEYFNELDRNEYKWSALCKNNVVALFRDSTMWITDSSSTHYGNIEDGLVAFYNSHPYFENQPATSMNAIQAKAYLHWLETIHQKQLNKNKIPLWVKYNLPTEIKDTTLFQIISLPLSLDSWKITNADYKKFVFYVQDSLARRILAQEYPSKTYLTPVIDSELQEIDEQNWNLNYETKIDWTNKTGVLLKGENEPLYGLLYELFYPKFQGDTNLIDKRKLSIIQYFYDFKNASIELEKGFVNGDQYYNEICADKKFLNRIIPESLTHYKGEATRNSLGKTLNLSYVNEENCTSTDIYSHERRSRFIIQDQLNVYPGIVHREPTTICMKDNTDRNIIYEIEPDQFCTFVNCQLCPQKTDWEVVPEEYDFDSNPDALITNITYFQYIAYWRWRIKKGNYPNESENPLIQNYIPSKDEFKKIQNGKAALHPQEVANMPTPGFGYVVSFYEK